MLDKHKIPFSTDKRFLLFLVVFFLPLFLAGHKPNDPKTKNINHLSRVVIDAGHGGQDSGALGKKGKEKDIVLSIALKLGRYIEENFKDVEVIYTRKEDVFIPLYERADIANQNNADLFISIHANANATNKEAIGTETYTMGLHTDEKNFEVAKKENSVIVLEKDYSTQYEGFDPNSPESYIIFSLMQNKFLEQSLTFASSIQKEFSDEANRSDRGVKQAGFLVLWRTSMPSVLIETGFISNPQEEKYLMSDSGQNQLARSIFLAFSSYKEYIEGHSSTPDKGSLTTQFLPKTDTLSIRFKSQITASGNRIPLHSEHFTTIKKAFPDSSLCEIYQQSTYKYLIGNAQNYKEAVQFNKKVKKYFPDAFIVAVQNGKIIPLSQALNSNTNQKNP